MNNHGTSEPRFYEEIRFENEKNREWNGRQKKVLLFLEQNPTIFLHKDEAILLEGMVDELWSA